ncbi:unnamed protein product [Brassica rapa subsp. trilocularis]
MFWDSGFFNVGKCRVLLCGELSSPVGELSGVPTSWCELGDARGSWRTRPVFLSSFLIQNWVFVVEWTSGNWGLVLAAVVSVPSFASPAMGLCVIWLLVVWFLSRECWRGSWQGFIFLVFGRASFFDRRAFMYPRRVDRAVVPLVEV